MSFLDIPVTALILEVSALGMRKGTEMSATLQTYWQQSRRWMTVVIVGAAIVLGYLVGVADAAADRLYAADDNLTKAVALLQATDTSDTGDEKDAREVQRHIDRAIANAERARAEVAKAIAASP